MLGLVMRDGARVVLVSVVAGSALALAAGRWAAPLLFHVSPRDPVVYMVVAGVLLMVAGAATWAPARAAARVDPSQVLRAE